MGISTHILDTALGRPATNVPVSLSLMTNGEWSVINETTTDADGRCKHLLPASQDLHRCIYRIHFETAAYYEQMSLTGFYPYVEVVFIVSETDQHYHVPLLLSANGYTTYRGS